jgi:hypothetical protein
MMNSIKVALKKFAAQTWQFFASVVVVFIAFLSQFHDFKSPDMVLEVTSVKATSSQPVDLIRFPELTALKSVVGDDYRMLVKNDAEYSPEEIERVLLIYKNRITSITQEIDNTERKMAFGFQGADSKSVLDQLMVLDEDSNLPLSMQRSLMSPSLVDSSTNTSIEKKIEDIKANLVQSLEIKRRERDDSNIKYNEAQKEWTAFKSTVIPSRTKLVIICAVGNQGSGATSLKPQALFRANLGEGNYLDFSMKMSNYDSSPEAATLGPQSYKVIKFESEEIQSMTAADRERFKSFLGNASPARIYVSDVRGDVYASNSVPFSPGVYEQKMFDALKQFASSKNSQ